MRASDHQLDLFSSRFSFRRQFTGQQGKEGDHSYSTLPIPPAQKHSDILCKFECEMTTMCF